MQQDIYMGDELDSEWAQYIASLTSKNEVISQKYREKKRIEQHERETMINLQKHVRGLSRARFELEDSAMDSFDDTSSDSPLSFKSNSCSDDDIQPQPTPSVGSLIGKPLNYSNYNINHKQKKRNTKTLIKPIFISNLHDVIDVDADPDDPYNIKSDEMESNYDSNDSDINDSHCLNDSNDSNDSLSDSNSNGNSSPHSLSKGSSTDSMQYDPELADLQSQLNSFRKRNYSRIRRTQSHEEVLLSVLNIDEKDIDKKQLEKCTKKAINKYKTITEREKRRVERKKWRKLADPYDEEWNGLDPDGYVWYDDMPEGQCYDDKELSLRDRRMQYLVVMAIENHYCTISDLSYQQNELLLLFQQSLKF